MYGALDGGNQILLAALRTHGDECFAGLLLQEREKHGRLLILGQRAVFSIFDYSNDLRAFAVPILEVAADGLVDRSEDLDRKLPVHQRSRGCLVIIIP